MSAAPSTERPLGVKSKFTDPALLETLAFIEQYDLEGALGYSAVNRLVSRAATREFKRFLALPLLYPGEQQYQFVPSLPLDRLWHAFILNTPRYREFCDRVYGRYLDHVPGRSRRETERNIFSGPTQFTVERLQDAFDDVNKRFWRKIVHCGPCSPFRR
jgi:hypothetical protein